MRPVDQPAIAQDFSKAHPGLLQSHLPSLDGMRAISIVLVLVAHGTWAAGRQDLFGAYLGRLGVSVFFVISGLLITWLMIRERDATNAFSLRNFYIRRFLRILPVYWLLIFVVIFLKHAHVISIPWLDIVRAVTFTHNYPASLAHPYFYAWWLDHTWSLSVEEQFYLLWPTLFALLPSRFAPGLTVILTFSGPILRILIYFLFHSLRGLDYNGFEYHVDHLMAGCASAFLIESSVWRGRVLKMPVCLTLVATSSFLLVLNPILISHLSGHSFTSTAFNLIVPTIEAVAIALTLLVVVAGKQGLVFRTLNCRALVHLGKLSYSLYIWQQLFLLHRAATNIFSLLWRLLAIYLVAFCSFNFFERPFLKLRGKFRHGVSV